MVKVALFCGGELTHYTKDFGIFVGVDRGALFLVENNLPLTIAVGDFDSVSVVDFERIKAKAGELVMAHPEKDDTDTGLAMKHVFHRYPDAQVTLFGAFGGRIDHMLSNIFLPSNPDLAPYLTQMVLEDATNHISYLPAGTNHVLPKAGKTYVAFMAEETSQLTIVGAKYNLTSANFFKRKIYSSNEFLGCNPIAVTIDEGYVVVIQTSDRS